MADPEYQLRDAPQLSRLELHVDGALAATVIYRKDPGTITFMTTDVMPGFEGQGIGGRIVGEAVRAAQEQEREVVAVCPFMTGYLERHPELLDSQPGERRSPGPPSKVSASSAERRGTPRAPLLLRPEAVP